MGSINKLSRKILSGWGVEEFDEFLDDVVERGLSVSCEERFISMTAVLNWIEVDEGRMGRYAGALRVRAEIGIHETDGIVDGATPEDVMVAKLRVSQRNWKAAKWNAERYGERVDMMVRRPMQSEAALVAQLRALVAGNPELLEMLRESKVVEGVVLEPVLIGNEGEGGA